MRTFELTLPAEQDLKEIARYTLTKWGRKQSLHYAGLLENRFREIAARAAHSRSFSERYPQVRVSRCEHHYIFHIYPKEKPPCIIAVLHEKMAVLNWLKNRID